MAIDRYAFWIGNVLVVRHLRGHTRKSLDGDSVILPIGAAHYLGLLRRLCALACQGDHLRSMGFERNATVEDRQNTFEIFVRRGRKNRFHNPARPKGDIPECPT